MFSGEKMNLTSTVGTARIGTMSLRATIPEGIVAFLELKEGDRIEWEMQVANNERSVIVRRLKPVLDEETLKTAKNYAKKKVVT
jgi:bifunctional DNA-binding transcriptional regulator/antitoxin component of YhaV-PrlF toxin-antitoxin module